MDRNLPRLYKDYGQYSNYRNFPADIDGLKPVERRVLLAAYKIARNNFVKSRRVDSHTTGHYHPHGECITGDTEILLLNGKKVKIKDLVGVKQFWVYSCTQDGVIKPGLAHSARIVKKVSKLYRILLDNNKYFECTEDHPVMLRDGTFVQVKDLNKNDSLMPLYLRQESGYTFYKDNSRSICREEKVSWMVMREQVGKDFDDLVGFKKYHVHHKNHLRNDDTPNNLELLYYKDHTSETAKNRSEEINKNIDDAINQAKDYNHRIINIEIIHLDEPVEVYDISVEKYHNFAIDCGVFVHNCYGTIVQLVRQGFLTGQGNFGLNVGVEPVGPAAPRYTECKLSPISQEMLFKYIKYMPFIDTEMGDKEPVILPAMFPVCLMGNDYTQGIGFGYKTYIPCYNIKDLYQRLLYLLKLRKRKPTIAPITDCSITSNKTVLEDLLTKGKAKIDVEGIIEINQNESKVILRSWPPGKRFQSLLNKFSTELDNGMIGFTDLSVENTKILFSVLRERNRTKIFNDFVEKLKDAITGTITFEIVLVDINKNVIIKSIDDMLIDTYKMFYNINKDMLETEIAKTNETINEYKTLEQIKAPLSQCIGNGLDIDSSINFIQKQTKISKKIISILIDKYKIKKLLTLNTDTSVLEENAKGMIDSLNNLDEFVLNQYNKICEV